MQLTVLESLNELTGIVSAKLWKRKTTRVRTIDGNVYVFKAAEDEAKGYCVAAGQRYKHEIIAYQIAQILGIYNVPETRVATVKGRIGSLQIYVMGSSAFRHKSLVERNKELKKFDPEILARCAAFDMLLGNSDRNRSNFFIIPRRDGPRLYLIDHGMILHSKSNIGHVGRVVRSAMKLKVPEEIQTWPSLWLTIKDVLRFHRIEKEFIDQAYERLVILCQHDTIGEAVAEWRKGQDNILGKVELAEENEEKETTPKTSSRGQSGK